ncbi:MAG: acyl-CoA dehydrogenase family protein [Firmicutes bacterium]|nr:acyl-CoA dehydrogenase family protein [Bacillota bacterium]
MQEAEVLARWRHRVRDTLSRLPAPPAGDDYPVEAVTRLLALGIQRIPFAAALGGEGLGLRGFTAVLEDVAAVDASLAAVFMASYSAAALLAAAGTPEQQAAWLTPLLAGQGLAAMAVSEAGAGSDVAAIRTTCRRLNDGRWRLDGSKAFITNTGHPLWRWSVVLARGPQPDRHTVFVVPADAAGLTVDRRRATLGWNRAGIHDLRLDGVVVPDANRLGPAGEGLRQVLAAFDRGRIAVAALGAGLCRGAWEQATAHARSRHTFGRPLIAHQAVADHLVQLWRLYTRARLLTGQAAAVADRGETPGAWAALAKWEAAEAAVEAARLAIQVRGGAGLLRGDPVAALWGDAKTLEIVEGTNEVQAWVLRRYVQGDGLPAAPGEGGARHADA